jgi:hypothetical protein
MTQIFFLFDDGPRGTFMEITTGCKCYHTGFLAEGYIYDIAPRGTRKIKAVDYFKKNTKYILLESPVEIPITYLNAIAQTEVLYGYLDYIGFFLRTFKLRVNDWYGQICSEKVMEDLYANGWRTNSWKPGDAPLSPCDLLELLRDGN